MAFSDELRNQIANNYNEQRSIDELRDEIKRRAEKYEEKMYDSYMVELIRSITEKIKDQARYQASTITSLDKKEISGTFSFSNISTIVPSTFT